MTEQDADVELVDVPDDELPEEDVEITEEAPPSPPNDTPDEVT